MWSLYHYFQGIATLYCPIEIGKGIRIAGISIVSLALACLFGLILTGVQIGWDPFASLYSWDKEVNPIAKKYDASERQSRCAENTLSRLTAQLCNLIP